jgi:hypothetical protein
VRIGSSVRGLLPQLGSLLTVTSTTTPAEEAGHLGIRLAHFHPGWASTLWLIDAEDVAPGVGEGEPSAPGVLVQLHLDRRSGSLNAR